MRFSVTEMGTYMRCPQKWDLTSFNRQGLEPIMKAPALSFGTLWHKFKEDWQNALYIDGLAPDTVDPIKIYNDNANEMIAQITQAYNEIRGVKPSGVEMVGVLNAIQMGRSMVENYVNYWHEPIAPDFRLLKSEQTVIVPIPGTEHCECGLDCTQDCDLCKFGTGVGSACPCAKHPGSLGDYCSCVKCHELEATLDGLLVHRKTDVFYIEENKTFGSHPSLEELQRNWQFLCYIWAARESFHEDVRGIAYDGVWKRGDIPRNKDGSPRAKKDGTKYSMDDLFLRTTLIRSPRELQSLPSVLAHIATEMASEPYIYRVVPPVKGCILDCKQNIRLCDSIWRGENTDIILQHYQKRPRTAAYALADEVNEE